MREKYQKIYEQYQNGEMDARLEELKNKVEERTATQEENKEMKKIERIKGNMGKINNVLELQEKLDKEAKELEEEIKNLHKTDKIEDLRKEAEKLEEELKKIEAEKIKLQEELKNASDDKEKTSLKEKIKNLDEKIDENNSKYQKNAMEMLHIQNESKVKKEFEGMSVEELEDKYNDVKNKSSKCNLVIVNLLNGRNWDDIEKKLENYQDRKFTCKEKLSERKGKEGKTEIEKAENKKKVEKAETEKTEGTKKVEKLETEKTENAEKVEKEEATENVDLVVVSEFERKHPRLARIGKWFKEKYNQIFGGKDEDLVVDITHIKEGELKTDSNEEKEETKIEEKTQEKSERDDFIKYLKDVAEKGVDGVDKERREGKLRAAKEQAYDRETKKFNKDYAERSYHKDEGNEIGD